MNTYSRRESWSLQVRERDNYTCSSCGEVAIPNKNNIIAHHKIPYQEGTLDSDFDITNGTTLCRRCHVKLHRLGVPMSPETREGMSKSAKIRCLDPEHIEELRRRSRKGIETRQASIALDKNSSKWSPEQRANRKETFLEEKLLDPNYKERMQGRGRKAWETRRRNGHTGIGNKSNTGKSWSPEQRANQEQAVLKRKEALRDGIAD